MQKYIILHKSINIGLHKYNTICKIYTHNIHTIYKSTISLRKCSGEVREMTFLFQCWCSVSMQFCFTIVCRPLTAWT